MPRISPIQGSHVRIAGTSDLRLLPRMVLHHVAKSLKDELRSDLTH